MEKGDFINVEYVGRINLTGDIFDLTSEELAKKEGIHNPNHPYGPALIIIGSNMVIPGVMSELDKMKVGEEREFQVGPTQGFGLRDPKLIKIVPISKFIENKINPIPGEFFDVDGTQAKVQSVSGGRVRVDFNNPLAGKMLDYKVKILEKIDGDVKKIETLLKYYKMDFSGVDIKTKNAIITSKKPLNPIAQKMFSDMITKWIKSVEKVEFEQITDKKTKSANINVKK